MNAEIARAVVDKFPQMVEAAATLLRAADGAGLPSREPRVIGVDDRDDDDEDDVEVTPPGFDLNAIVAQLVPMIVTGHSTPAMHSHYSHVDSAEKADAVGKVIDLVTKAVKREPEDRKRGLERGLDVRGTDPRSDPETENPAIAGSSVRGATQI